MNPFFITGYKSPDYFCDRELETAKLLEAVRNQRNVTIISERRLGKTSLLRHIEYKLKNERIFIYIDLYPTLCLTDFIRLLSDSLIRKLEPFSEKLIKKVTRFFSSVKPRFSFDPETGSPNLEFTVNTPSEAEKSIELLFAYIRQSGKTVTLAFDEFQQILNYPEQNIEALLRSEIQKDTDTSYIFSGSHTHLLLSMFNDYSRPFYQSTEILHLKKIGQIKYSEFIKSKFEESKRKIDASTPDYIYSVNDGITFNVQYLSNKLFSFNEEIIDNKLADKILREILNENELIYYNYRELVTKLQFKILKAVAKEKIVEKPFSTGFITAYKLGSASSVKTATNTLLNKGLLSNNNKLRVTDLYFSLWLAKQL